VAGHNRWSKVKHRKAVVDKRKGKALTMCSRAIMVAARAGGADPEFNFALRQAIDEARYHNVPRENIDRAIKKGAGGGEGDDYENVRYEGYGPGGVAVVIDALTNNRTRTAGDLRLILGKHGGNLGATGCVGFMFATLGRIVVPARALDEERLTDVAATAGADDVKFEIDDPDEGTGEFIVLTPVEKMQPVRGELEGAGFRVTESRITPVPTTTAAVAGDAARALLALVDALEDNDDVQRVHTNADIPDDVLESMA
jgi:YebC/PmpR family DNA-binding regulatory protein